MLQEAHSLVPQGSHGMLQGEPAGMLPHTEGPPNFIPPPYMALPGLASAGFPTPPYALPQLGQLFPPNPQNQTSGAGQSILCDLLALCWIQQVCC